MLQGTCIYINTADIAPAAMLHKLSTFELGLLQHLYGSLTWLGFILHPRLAASLQLG